MMWCVTVEGENKSRTFTGLRSAQLFAKEMRDNGQKVKVTECYPSGKEVDVTEEIL